MQYLPTQALNPIQSIWPFAQWVFDLIGYFVPPYSGDHKFIVTVTKYFTKWVEVEPLVSIIGPKIANFIDTHIIHRFGISHKIISDNGLCFKNQHVIALCNVYNIHHSFSTPHYPQDNGKA